MVLTGGVTNVTDFGAFVGVGGEPGRPGQVSHLASYCAKNSNDAITVGLVLKALVLSAGAHHKRIALSIKEAEESGEKPLPAAAAQDVKTGPDLCAIEQAGSRVKWK